MQISRCRFWVCSRCNSVFEKQDLARRLEASQTTAPIFLMGTGAIECAVCQAVHQEGEVYHGSHDLPRGYWWELEAKSGHRVELQMDPASLARQPSRSVVMQLPGIERPGLPDAPIPLPSADAPESDWVDYLWSIHSGYPNASPDFSMEELTAIAERLHSALEARLGRVAMSCETQDRTDYANFSFEQRWIREPDNIYAAVILSQTAKLVVIYLEWDFTAEALDFIRSAIAEAGCIYVPFRLFAEPQHYQWKAFYNVQYHSIRPAADTVEMKRELLWGCFFDYE